MEQTYLNGLNTPEEFYKSLKFCLKFWGGEKLETKSPEVLSVFAERGKNSIKESVERLEKIVKENFKDARGVTADDIVYFLLTRYLQYLRCP